MVFTIKPTILIYLTFKVRATFFKFTSQGTASCLKWPGYFLSAVKTNIAIIRVITIWIFVITLAPSFHLTIMWLTIITVFAKSSRSEILSQPCDILALCIKFLASILTYTRIWKKWYWINNVVLTLLSILQSFVDPWVFSWLDVEWAEHLDLFLWSIVFVIALSGVNCIVDQLSVHFEALAFCKF